MRARPFCLVHSQDEDWMRRVATCLAPVTDVRRVTTPAQLAGALDAGEATVLLLDLLADGVAGNVADIPRNWPLTVVLAFGAPGSDPFVEATQADLYAVEDREADGHRLRTTAACAIAYLRLRQENAGLRLKTDQSAAVVDALRDDAAHDESASLAVRHLPGALRHVDDIRALLQGLAEDVARALLVSRVGIFYRPRDVDDYRLHAGTRCLEGTSELAYDTLDPLVRWFVLHAHVVTRDHLARLPDADTREILRQAMERLGAEVLVPLQSRERLHGWMVLGHRATGLPFEPQHIEKLVLVAEHVSTALENAWLYGEAALQRTRAEALLHTLPIGVIAVDPRGLVRWFNRPAGAMLGIRGDAVVDQPVERLGLRIADLLHRALIETPPGDTLEEWPGLPGHRLEVRVRRLLDAGGASQGAMLTLRDITVERDLAERQAQAARALFWAELAAAMSHEIRNPLVPIKTYAQLLPERYEDPDFRREFGDLMASEIDRLIGIVDQIHAFAHPPALQFVSVDLAPLLRRAAAALKLDAPENLPRLGWQLDTALPRVRADERALQDAIERVLDNAREALRHRGAAAILTLQARSLGKSVAIAIGDNGPGIDPALQPRLFSPFSTTKARGLGLGLAIVQRTMTDHGGQVDIDTGPQGTRVTLTLPVYRDGGTDDPPVTTCAMP